MTIGAENGGVSIIQGNGTNLYTKENYNSDPVFYTKHNEAIFVKPTEEWDSNISDYITKESTLTLSAKTGGKLVINDKINGHDYNVKITGDETGAVYVGDKISAIKVDKDADTAMAYEGNVDISLEGTNLLLSTFDNVLDNNNLKLNSGALSMINGQVGQMTLNNLDVAQDTKFFADVDLANQNMDRIVANSYTGDAKIVVEGFSLLSDSPNEYTEIVFAQGDLKDNVRNNVPSTNGNRYQRRVFSPIFKYDVNYVERNDAGYFTFSRGTSSNSVSNFNPAVLGASTATIVGALGTLSNVYNYAFVNSDRYMNIPYLEKTAMKNSNSYALNSSFGTTDIGRFSPLYQKGYESRGAWIKPYATFENIPLKNGPKVDNISYGTLVGFDTEMKRIKKGWDRVFTGYIGYNGASQDFLNVDSMQNGGLLGTTMTLYKGNFFNATTLTVGASVAKNKTMYGSEDFTMLLSGVANKSGYNIEFKNGKIILQPSLLLAYNFINTFDYTNAAGVKIETDPFQVLQIAPGLKLIGNLNGGWQPYLATNFVWNIGETDFYANGFRLPEMSIKPYIQYGLGLQKIMNDRFSAYGQSMIQNGGRNGVSLVAGLHWNM